MKTQNGNQTIIAIACQKGGVGKTTTAWNFAAGLNKHGCKTLLIDCDPDHHLSFAVGWEDDGRPTLTNLILSFIVFDQFPDESAIQQTIRHHKEGYDYIPCTKKLRDANKFLATVNDNETVLRHILRDTDALCAYDYIVLDGLPGDNLLQNNILTAADACIIPVQPQILPFSSLLEMVEIVNGVRRKANPDLEIAGYLITICERTSMAAQVKETLISEFDEPTFQTVISRLNEAATAPLQGHSCVADPKSRIGRQYMEVTAEYLKGANNCGN